MLGGGKEKLFIGDLAVDQEKENGEGRKEMGNAVSTELGSTAKVPVRCGGGGGRATGRYLAQHQTMPRIGSTV